MKKRFFSLILALLMLVPLLVACGNTNQGEDTGSSTTASADATGDQTKSLYDENGYLLDDLPEGLNFKTTLNMLMWDDHTMHEFGWDVEEMNGDGIDGAIYTRESLLEKRLGVTINYIATPGDSDDMNAYIQKVEADYNADRDYDIYAGYSRTAPQLSLKGYTIDLLATEYFKVEKPWWPEALVKECMFGDKLFFCSGDISTNMLWMMIATFYNKTFYGNYNFEKTPEQLVDAHEWTFEKFFGMTQDVYEDVDSSQSKGASDKYGAVIYETNIDAFQTAAGITSIVRTNDGGIDVNPDYYGERIANACEQTGKWLASKGVYHTNSTTIRNVFFEERAMFITDRVFIVAGKDNAASSTKIEFEYGIIPQPLFDKNQQDFLTNLGHPFTTYAISSGSKQQEAASATLECLASENYRLVTPEIFESAMKFKYATGSEAASMYDIIRRTVSFDLGRLLAASFSNHTTNLFRKTALSTNPGGYLTAYKGAKPLIEKGRDDLLGQIEALN